MSAPPAPARRGGLRSRLPSALAVALLGVVLALLALPGGRASPGALAAAHSGSALASSAGCAQCHAPSDGGLAAGCASCHADVSAELDDGAGLHGQLDPALARDCARCHGEHQGRNVALVGALAFERAGYSDADAYDHAGLDFQLAGEHARLACERCHAEARATVLAAGTQRFLGLEQRCDSCHADPHAAAYGQDCASCHGQQRPFAEAADFDHERWFPLADAHAGLACARCHAAGTRWSLAERAPQPATGEPAAEPRSCRACHADPHAGQFALAAFAGQDCLACHDRRAFRPATFDVGQHAHSRFPLTGGHLAASCNACHVARDAGVAGAAPAADTARVFIGTPTECAACHADVHAGSFDGPGRPAVAGGDTGCARCHTTASFRDVPAESFEHAAWTGYTLAGAHADLHCAACHVPDRAAQDAAGRSFGRARGTQCSDCHSVEQAARAGSAERR